MKRNTIKWRILKYNVIVIFLLIALTTVIFNIAVRLYIEKDVTAQLSKIASRTEETALHQGGDFFPNHDEKSPPKHLEKKYNEPQDGNELFRFYFMLDRSIREPLSVLNADYILFDSDRKVINPASQGYFTTSEALTNKITDEIGKSQSLDTENYLSFQISGTKYIAIVKPVSNKNSFGLGWVVIYSSLQKVNQLQWDINLILFAILILSALVIVIFSSLATKKISAPLSSLNEHITSIAERNFGAKINIDVDDELQGLVNNINLMSEKLEAYDNAQKTFFQNASHEFRTPLMSIQSYAEGIKYGVVDTAPAVDIILDEAKRMTNLVEDLLYLSRLDAIEENYHLSVLNFNELIYSCVGRMEGIMLKKNIKIKTDFPSSINMVYADAEKLSRAVTNILSNCARYANSTIELSLRNLENNKLELMISDDGPGFETTELPNIFERFYKGKKGKFGLGLTITKSIIEKHSGEISANNSTTGAVFRITLPQVNE